LKEKGHFLTRHGLATESPKSRYYQPDGYWRGPIWAPATLLIADGLAACGEKALARTIARRFCDLCAAGGMAENFDALSGAGLRDRAYTWTASVFLILGHDYLR
jgi:glycogen debranching enzyme